jgi:hypothetical protein
MLVIVCLNINAQNRPGMVKPAILLVFGKFLNFGTSTKTQKGFQWAAVKHHCRQKLQISIWTVSHTAFSLQLMNWPNKLECYITLGWKGLIGKNVLAYWTQV